MSKKKKFAKAAAALGAAYLATKMGGKEKPMKDTYFGGGKTGDASIAENIARESRIRGADVEKGLPRGKPSPEAMEDYVAPKSKKMKPGASMPFKSMSGMFGFKSGGSVVTKGQGKVMKPKKTILLT